MSIKHTIQNMFRVTPEKVLKKENLYWLSNKVIHHNDINVRIAAAKRLGQLKSNEVYTYGSSFTPVAALTWALQKDSNEEVRHCAVWAIGEIGHASALAPLIEVLKNKHVNNNLKLEVASAIEKLGPNIKYDKNASALLSQILKDEKSDYLLKKTAINAIKNADQHDSEIITSLLQTFQKDDPDYSLTNIVNSYGVKDVAKIEAAAAYTIQDINARSRFADLITFIENSKGSEDIYEMLRSRSVEEIRQFCVSYPIDALHLDFESISQDFRHSKRFEFLTVLAEVFLKYDDISKQRPDLDLPESIPADELANILISRLMSLPEIKEYGGYKEIAHRHDRESDTDSK